MWTTIIGMNRPDSRTIWLPVTLAAMAVTAACSVFSGTGVSTGPLGGPTAASTADAGTCGDSPSSVHKRAATVCSDVNAFRSRRTTVRLQAFTDSLVLVRK